MKWPKREVLVVVVGILILGLAGGSALAQKKKEKLEVEKLIQRQERPQNVVSINVLGLSQGVINLEYEGPNGYVALEFGSIGGATLFAVTVGRKDYWGHTAPRGLWSGFFVGFAMATEGGHSASNLGLGGSLGMKLLLMDLLTIEGRLGAVFFDLRMFEPGRSGESDWYVGVNVGFAF